MSIHDKILDKLKSLFPNDSIELTQLKPDSNTFVLEQRFVLNGELSKVRLGYISEEDWNSSYCGIPFSSELMHILYQELSLALGHWKRVEWEEVQTITMIRENIVTTDGKEPTFPKELTDFN